MPTARRAAASPASPASPAPLRMEWDPVRVFLAVARGGSLAAAAERLGVDISTVSRRLDRLEADLGGALFDRTREGTRPTALGETLLGPAEEMELCAARFSSAGAQVETAAEGPVRLSVVPGVADHFVAPALLALRRRHPGIVVELDASVAYADLTRREADLAVRTQRPQSGDLVSVQLITTRVVPMTSPRYLRALGPRGARTLDLPSLAAARFITWGSDLAHLPSARWLRATFPQAEVALRTSHFPSQLAAARAGLGVVLAAEAFARGGLVPVVPGRTLAAAFEALPVEELWLVGHRALRTVPRVAAVWDFLRALFAVESAAAARGR